MPTHLADFQWEYDGLVFGDDAPIGVIDIEGLEGFQARIGDRELPRGHGDAPGRHFAASKLITFQLEIMGDSETVQGLVDEVRRAFRLRSTPAEGLPLRFRLPGRSVERIHARPAGVSRSISHAETLKATPTVALKAADSGIYGDELRNIIVHVFGETGGLDYPGDYPKDFPAGVSREEVARNGGGADAHPLIRVHGPTTGWTLHNRTTGQQITVGATMTAGQILTVDTPALITPSGALVVRIGNSSRYGDWAHPRDPFRLAPGDNVLRFTADDAGEETRAVLNYRDTSLS